MLYKLLECISLFGAKEFSSIIDMKERRNEQRRKNAPDLGGCFAIGVVSWVNLVLLLSARTSLKELESLKCTLESLCLGAKSLRVQLVGKH